MPLFRKSPFDVHRHATWRDYQSRRRRPAKVITLRRLVLAGLVTAAVFYALIMGMAATRPLDGPVTTMPHRLSVASNTAETQSLIQKSDVQLLLSQLAATDLMASRITLPFNNQPFTVTTSLDEPLQQHLIGAMDRRHSRFIGIVVMEADTGRVLALAGYDKADPEANPCLSSIFPAASLFKIVTAAAAVDHYHYKGHTKLRFNGDKHTLYRNQLQETNNRYTHTITFADAFAQSVNPVFGKLGKLNLGKELLEQYAESFGFNRPIDFELPVPPSQLSVKDDPYHWAEIASGFNRDTTISPLHAAMITSAALNQGRMAAPTLVERIEDDGGRLLYHFQSAWSAPTMTPEAATVLSEIMAATVQSGTARSAFSGWQRDPVLSGLRIGGKTGSIFNSARDARIDWFAGYATRTGGHEKLVVASLVAHQEYIGVRAGTYARKAMAYYFKHTAAQTTARKTPSGS